MSEPPPYRRSIAECIRAQAVPADKFAHQPRLYEVARCLAEGQVYDDDVLYAAAWMHDLGVFVGHRPEEPARLAAWDNVSYALKVAPQYLQQCGFPGTKIPAVVEVIRTHLPSGCPGTIEGVLLLDADILEQLGAIGILRVVSKVGRDTRFPTHAHAVRVVARNADELPTQLKLPLARRMAEPRIAVMRAFLAAVQEEARAGFL